MCGRIGIGKRERSDWLDTLLRPLIIDVRYNVPPSAMVPLILREDDHDQAVLSKWGLVPFWLKDGTGFSNARGETASAKPAFRNAYKKRRGLVVADFFYEWQKPAEAKGKKQPYLIQRRDQTVMVMAALWEGPVAEGGPTTCSIVTIGPNDVMLALHDRMPVVLEEADFTTWLDPKTPLDKIQKLIRPASDDILEAYPVSRMVSTGADDKRCTERIVIE